MTARVLSGGQFVITQHATQRMLAGGQFVNTLTDPSALTVNLVVADASQGCSTTSAVITREIVVVASSNSQSSLSSTGEVTRGVDLGGYNNSQVGESESVALESVVVKITGSNTLTTAISGQQSIAQEHVLRGDGSATDALSAQGTITKIVLLSGTDSTQDNTTTQASLSSVLDVLIANVQQGAFSTSGQVAVVVNLESSYSVQANESYSGSASKVIFLTVIPDQQHAVSAVGSIFIGSVAQLKDMLAKVVSNPFTVTLKEGYLVSIGR